MRRVVIESPYKEIEGEEPEASRRVNAAYLQECIRDCFRRGEACFASHQMYTMALDDAVAEERRQGLLAGFEWHRVADWLVVYTDRGISDGMKKGIENATLLGVPIVYRTLWLANDPRRVVSGKAA